MKAEFERLLDEERERAEKDAAKKAEKRIALEMAASQELLKEQAKELEEARRNEVAMRRRERELEERQADLEVTIERTRADERTKLVDETQQRVAEEHRLKDAEKERQLADMRRQIEDLKRKAEQGSQQLQGEVGEAEIEALLRSSFPSDDIRPIGQGVRGADLHQVVLDARGMKS